MTVDYKDKSHGGSFTVRNFGGKASATCQVMVRPELRTTAAMIQQASGDKAEKATCTVLRVTRFLN